MNSHSFKRIAILLIVINLFCIQGGIAQDSQKTVIAEKGDGVFSLLRKNGIDPTQYHSQFVELNSENISDENGLYVGKLYRLPSVEDSIAEPEKKIILDRVTVKGQPENIPELEVLEYPVFGKNHSLVTIESQTLKGAVYYLISGHGGPDPGAVERYGEHLISEDEYAYDVNLRLARKLIANGATVYLIVEDANDGIRDQEVLEIDYDEVNYPNEQIPRSQKLRLKQRTETVNTLFFKHGKSYQRLIVIHVDSRRKGEIIDVFFYHHQNSSKGKALAENIQSTFKKKYGHYQPNRTYSGTVAARSDLYVVKNTLPSTVYIELGNIKNAKDQKRILDFENREALAKWISEGLVLDYTQQ